MLPCSCGSSAVTIKEEVEGLPENIKAEPILIYSVLKKKNEKDFADHVDW